MSNKFVLIREFEEDEMWDDDDVYSQIGGYYTSPEAITKDQYYYVGDTVYMLLPVGSYEMRGKKVVFVTEQEKEAKKEKEAVK